MNNGTAITGFALCSAILLGVVSAYGANWNNALGDNVMTNVGNWDATPVDAFLNLDLAGADRAILSDGMSLTIKDLRLGINGPSGELEITGGFLRSARVGGDNRIGYSGNTGIINQSGGTNEVAQDLAIGFGGTGTYNLSGGLLSNQDGYLQVGAATGSGRLEISGGTLETINHVLINGTGTFAVHGAGATSIGIGSQANGSAYWQQNAGGTLEVLISSNGITTIVVDDFDDGGNANVTFNPASLLDVGFLDAGYAESNTWTIMTWEGTVTDYGLQFATNVDINVWSFEVTSNALQVTYGVGSEPPPVPPTGPRTIYWSSDATNTDMTVAANWVTNGASGYQPATWGLYESDTVFIGHNGANPVEGPVYEATYAGGTAKNQSKLTIGYARTGLLNFNSGELDFNAINNQIKLGEGVRGHGTLNMNGGSLEGESFRVGMSQSSNTGTINMSGGTLTAARGMTVGTDGGLSLSLGQNGAYGEMNVSGGDINFRFGALLGHGDGTGRFHVEGSGATRIGFGTKDTNNSGKWIQNSGSTLSVAIDEGGLTPITIEGWAANNATATFESNSILEIAWSAGVTNYGMFDVMKVGGEIIDNGLMLSTNVNADIWSFAMVDTDSDTTNDTLRVYANAGNTTNGTPILWLDGYYDVPGDFPDWDAAALSDTDGDGLLAWEEYVAGTDPTDGNSVLKISSLVSVGADYIVSWQSVEGKSYSIITNASLAYPNAGVVASGIPGAIGDETSVTSSLPNTSTLFIEVGVQ
ncbi:hypothetical protein P4C99_06110 [Pontiellaceae bacterium B1224]|nr:hypothetical protein [Pontiellaceae bacterium B1224]